MMKVLRAVMLCGVVVLGGSGHADEVVWQVASPFLLMPGRGLPEGSQAAKGNVPHEAHEQTQSQDAHERTGDRPTLYPQADAPAPQSANQQGQGKVDPDEQRFEWSSMGTALMAIVLAVVSIVVAVFYGRKARVDVGTQMVQSAELQFQEERAVYLLRIHGLEEKVVKLKSWNQEKECYELTEVSPGVFMYRLKLGMAQGKRVHDLCTNCFDKDEKSVLQSDPPGHRAHLAKCWRCGLRIEIIEGWK